MKYGFIYILLLSILLSGCGPSSAQNAATNTPVPTPNIQIAKTPADTAAPTTLEILKPITPTFEIYIDGEECIVEGPSELSPGEYLFILHNETDLPANVTIGSFFGEKTFDDYLLWREENCGGQGSHCEDDKGQYISYQYARWFNPNKQANEGRETQYKLFEIKLEGEYVITANLDGWWGWICAPIQVSNSP
jgi:hypothetical protein